METVVVLATFLFFANGQMKPHQTVDMPGVGPRALQMCWGMADTFVKSDPAAVGAVALGAGCIVKQARAS